jgi:maleate isomerase
MQKHLERAAKELAAATVDVIAFGCTTGSLLKGVGWDQEIIKRIVAETGTPATTTATAVVDALHKLNIRNLSVATPYVEELNKKEVKFLEGHGFKVVKIKGLGLIKGIGNNHPEVAYRLAREVNVAEAEGIFISCTNFRTIEIIERLESDLQKPVVTSNQATFWKVLRTVGIHEKIKGYGSLLKI